MPNMRRPTTRYLTLAAAAAATAAVLAGCGSDDDASGSDAGGGAAVGNDVVATQEMDGVGTILVDGSGHALYFSDQEEDGTIACVGACLEFWVPATATGPLPEDIPGLDAVRRDDTGDRQLTLDGVPLYTFRLDKTPGQVTGDNVTDTFGGVDFTWHAAVTDAGTGGEADTDDGDTGGYGNPYGY